MFEEMENKNFLTFFLAGALVVRHGPEGDPEKQSRVIEASFSQASAFVERADALGLFEKPPGSPKASQA